MTNDLARLIPRLKSLQRNMLQPENGSAHGICWQDNTEDASNRIKSNTICIFWLVEDLRLKFLPKAIFFRQQRNKFYFNYHGS